MIVTHCRFNCDHQNNCELQTTYFIFYLVKETRDTEVSDTAYVTITACVKKIKHILGYYNEVRNKFI